MNTDFLTQPWFIIPETHRQLQLDWSARLRMEGGAKPAARVVQAVDTGDIDGVTIQEGFALTVVSGVMTRHGGWWDEFSTAELEGRILALMDRPDIHTVIFHFNSPGGAAAGNAELAELIRGLSASKQTIAWVDDMAASAAYYLAAACDSIFARPTATVGSIGCYIALLDASGLYERIGLKVNAITTDEGKLYGADFQPLSEEARDFFTARVEEFGGQFKAFVKERRPGATKAAMESGVYGSAATWGMANGLVDEVFLTFDHMMTAVLERRPRSLF